MRRFLIPLMLLAVTLAGSCSKRADSTPSDPSAAGHSPESLAVGLMPAVDTAPIFLAQEKGYFSEAGLDLDITLFINAQDRQSALQSGAIDGAMTDLVALAVNASGGFELKATTLTDGMFCLLIDPEASREGALRIGLMEISLSHFLVDQWLAGKGPLEKVYINSIPARLEAVASGQLDMGFFPEPMASAGTLKGLEKVFYPPAEGYFPDVMAFTGRALEEKRVAIELFHQGYNRGVEDLRLSEDLARDVLLRSIPHLDPLLRDLITLPEYRRTRLPDAASLDRIIRWTAGMVDQPLDVSPEDLVDPAFLDL